MLETHIRNINKPRSESPEMTKIRNVLFPINSFLLPLMNIFTKEHEEHQEEFSPNIGIRSGLCFPEQNDAMFSSMLFLVRVDINTLHLTSAKIRFYGENCHVIIITNRSLFSPLKSYMSVHAPCYPTEGNKQFFSVCFFVEGSKLNPESVVPQKL